MHILQQHAQNFVCKYITGWYETKALKAVISNNQKFVQMEF